MAASDLTAARLREVLHYDEDTGAFTWRARPRAFGSGRSLVAGTAVTRGYIMIRVDGVKHLAHRLAWMYCYGAWPTTHIDHVDGNTANNAIANLRDVDDDINHQNIRAAFVTNKSGLLGAASTVRGNFVARIAVAGKRVHLGTFASAEAAHEAYLDAKRRLHAGCTI